jgi:hypothetical protein
MTNGKDGKVLSDEIQLVELIGAPAATTAVARGPAVPATAAARQAIRSVIGRTVSADDVGTARSALEAAFAPEQRNGRTVFVWKRAGSRGAAAGPGTLSFDQQRLVADAGGSIAEVRAIVDRLEPITRLEVGDEEIDAARLVVRTELASLESELANRDGPLPERVQSTLQVLERELGHLRAVARLDPRNVTTAEEDKQLIEFEAAQEHLRCLAETWERFRDRTNRFSTLTHRLTDATACIEDTLVELEARLDETARAGGRCRSAPITGADGLTVATYLSWVRSAVRDELRPILESGGRRGVAAVAPTLGKLARIAEHEQIDDVVARASFGVQAAWGELAEELREAARDAKRLGGRVQEQVPPDRIEIYQGANHKWFWRKLTATDEIVATGHQAFASEQEARRAARRQAKLEGGIRIKRV